MTLRPLASSTVRSDRQVDETWKKGQKKSLTPQKSSAPSPPPSSPQAANRPAKPKSPRNNKRLCVEWSCHQKAGTAVHIWAEERRGRGWGLGLVVRRKVEGRWGGVRWCTCVRVASWEKGRKQDLEVKQHPVSPPRAPPIPEVFMLLFLLLTVESWKEMIQAEADWTGWCWCGGMWWWWWWGRSFPSQ